MSVVKQKRNLVLCCNTCINSNAFQQKPPVVVVKLTPRDLYIQLYIIRINHNTMTA